MAPAIEDAFNLGALTERVDGHGRRLDGGEARMTRIEERLDRLVLLQYGALLSAAGSLVVGIVILLTRS